MTHKSANSASETGKCSKNTPVANQADLFLRPPSPSDALGVLTAFQSAPDMARQGEVTNLSQAQEYVDHLLSPDANICPWVLCCNGELAGLVAVTVDEVNRNGWFWYWMSANYRGRGLASAAAATVADWAITQRGLERLELGHRVNNPASGAVARHAGFIKEGTERAKFLIDGQRIAVDTYSRLSTDPFPEHSPIPFAQQG